MNNRNWGSMDSIFANICSMSAMSSSASIASSSWRP